MKAFFTNKKTLFILGIILTLLLWFLFSLIFDKNSMIFPSPITSFIAMVQLLGKKTTYQYIGNTLLRMIIGFIIAFVIALILGIFAGYNNNIYMLLKPMMNILKSVPTVVFVYLFIIIFKPKFAPIYVVMLVSMPIIFESVVQGIAMVNKSILNASKIDGANFLTQIFRIRLPLAIPYIIVGISSSLAMSFKVEIMAEVLSGMTKGGIGAAIAGFQASEVNLVNVFGYALIVIILVLIFTYISEYLKKHLINKSE